MKRTLLVFLLGFMLQWAHAQQKAKTIGNSVKSSLLSGIYSAPIGTNIILQNDGKNDLSLVAQKNGEKNFSENVFNFPNPVLIDSKIKVTVKKLPTGKTCAIYSGSEGIMSQNPNRVRVGCDFTYDLVSRNSNDAIFSSFYETYDPAIGGNAGEEGRYVVFVSAAANIAGSTGKHRQVFWRDRNTGVTKLISAGPNGEEGNADSYAPAISGDGKMVAFESYSNNLVQNDKNNARDVFVWHTNTNKIETVSVGINGVEANAESLEPSVSGDGNYVAFTSMASNISTIEKGVSNNNVFLRDLQKGSTIMISIDPSVGKGGGGSKPSISFDGNRIAFYSHTNTLVSGDNNGIWDIFLWEKGKSQLKRISLTADHKERNQGTESANRIVSPSISGNGQYIAFATTATNMTKTDTNNYQDVFVYDITNDTTVMASISAPGTSGNGDSPIEQGEKIAISFDGKWVAFTTNATNLKVPAANVVMHNLATGENKIVSSVSGSTVGRPSISHSGSYVVFGIGGKLDSRFSSSGIFANYTGLGPCRSCPQ